MDATQTPRLELEIQYYTPGKGWKRKAFKTQSAMDRFLDGLDSDVEVRFAVAS